MIIDADGLFNGNRWRKCSNLARLNAPYLLLASNGFARLEIDPARIIGRAYLTFNPRPSEVQIMAIIREYVEAQLLFLYEYDGQVWGQWDTPNRLLSKYKNAADKRSPTPPAKLFKKWLSEYHSVDRRSQRFVENSDTSFDPTNQYVTENSQKFSNVFKNLPSGIGVGVGEGIGDGKNICSSQDDERVSDPSLAHPKTKRHPASEEKYKQVDQWFESSFWPGYWRKVGKQAALKAWRTQVTTEQKRGEVIAGMERQRPGMLAKEEQFRPHAASWLNGQRWTDEVSPITSATNQKSAKEIWDSLNK